MIVLLVLVSVALPSRSKPPPVSPDVFDERVLLMTTNLPESSRDATAAAAGLVAGNGRLSDQPVIAIQ